MTFPQASIDQKPAFGLGSAKAFHAPLGAASPLWFAYAGAAGAGVAYWWMMHWMRPLNIEAYISAVRPLPIMSPAIEPEPVAELEPEPESPVKTAAPDAKMDEAAPPAAVEPAPAPELSPEAPPKTTAAVSAAAPKVAAEGPPPAAAKAKKAPAKSTPIRPA